MKSPKTMAIGVVVVLVALAAAYFLVIKPRGVPQAQENVPNETIPGGIDLTGLQNNMGGGNTATQPVQNTPPAGGWCMNYTKEAAYPDGAKFYSAYSKEWLVCRVFRGGFEKEDGRIIPTQIVTTQPTVGFAPWDGVTYAP